MSAAGDAEFTEWLEDRKVALLTAARRICFDNQNAEDVFQEAMVDVYRRWGKVRNHPNLDGYAIKVMVSKHADLRRKWARRQIEKERTLEYAEAIAPVVNLSEGWAEGVALNMALQELSAGQRSVLVLTYLYSMPIHEVAETLGIPKGTVASQLARGRDMVARYMNSMPEIAQSRANRELESGDIEDAEIVEGDEA